MKFSSHFCEGHLPIAFVFSAPGEEEKRKGKPVAGESGANLEAALVHLHSAQPTLFSSLHRYDYRITNSFAEPIAVALGHGKSEADNREIQKPQNVQRVLSELEGCNLVILCGNKARVLSQAIRESGKTIIEVPHIGNKGLNSKFKISNQIRSASSFDRRQYRIKLWAEAILQAIARENAT
ncbi:hypothetical protein [Nitrosomonas sp. Nm33]|uniref:hypothetical protein n=1 Tax=Nitrosomonas sp. Nm33 TaxID=133724 RepID=UPI00089C8BC8|nr:hypothetical protein [Nitrosomonas sp. Nm33]SDX92201.1 Uracil DNA glycosylase superfamily protein [Nitrosomonas sp. Nm33]